MRGDDKQQEGMFTYISPERRVPSDHPLGPIRKMVDEILKEMSPQFARLYSDVGRPSIAPERLLRSRLLRLFYSVRSERILNEEIAESFFRLVLERARLFMSDEHFAVDGTLVEAWASQKSFRPKDGTGEPPEPGGVDFPLETAELTDGTRRANIRMGVTWARREISHLYRRL